MFINLFQKKQTELVTVEICVKIGPNYENKKESGISHFLEHLVFCGTKKRKNAKVQWEMFGGQKVFVVSPERFYDSRLGKARYVRYEKYVGNDKLGETIRQYGRNNPKNSIILKNSGNGAMLYLKYGRN